MPVSCRSPVRESKNARQAVDEAVPVCLRRGVSSDSKHPTFLLLMTNTPCRSAFCSSAQISRIGLVHLEALSSCANAKPLIISNPTVSKAEVRRWCLYCFAGVAVVPRQASRVAGIGCVQCSAYAYRKRVPSRLRSAGVKAHDKKSRNCWEAAAAVRKSPHVYVGPNPSRSATVRTVTDPIPRTAGVWQVARTTLAALNDPQGGRSGLYWRVQQSVVQGPTCRFADFWTAALASDWRGLGNRCGRSNAHVTCSMMSFAVTVGTPRAGRSFSIVCLRRHVELAIDYRPLQEPPRTTSLIRVVPRQCVVGCRHVVCWTALSVGALSP